MLNRVNVLQRQNTGASRLWLVVKCAIPTYTGILSGGYLWQKPIVKNKIIHS